MDWDFVRTIVTIGIGFAAYDGLKHLWDRRKWQSCPILGCDFRIKTNDPDLARVLMDDHIGMHVEKERQS